MSYIEKIAVVKVFSPENNLIGQIINTLTSDPNYTSYSSKTFKVLLENINNDIESFKNDDYFLRTTIGELKVNIIQYTFAQAFPYLREINLNKETYQCLKKAFIENKFETELSKHISFKSAPSEDEKNTNIIKTIFSCMFDIEESLNIDAIEYLGKNITYIMKPSDIVKNGFSERNYSVFKEFDLFSAFCLKQQTILPNISFLDKDINNCKNILFLATQAINQQSTISLFKNPSIYDFIYPNIIEELKEIKKDLKAQDISNLNFCWNGSYLISELMKNNIFPSPEYARDFKIKFNELNPKYYTSIANRKKTKYGGFETFNKILVEHHDSFIVLDYLLNSFLVDNKNSISPRQSVIDMLLFFNNADKSYCKKAHFSNSKTTNRHFVVDDFFSTLKTWVEKNGEKFDKEYSILTTIINNGNFKNLLNYIDAIFNDKERLCEVDNFIKYDFKKNDKYLNIIINGKKVTHEEFIVSYDSYLLSKAVEQEVPLQITNNNKVLKF